jgi:fluoroquinolone transport system permease protein
MKKIITLAANDFKHVFRDRMLFLFLFTPVLLILFVRFFVPYLCSLYPFVEEYKPYIMMFACIQTSIMFGFITAFIMLEEKDENVLQAIRVLPISPEYFITYRLLFATCFSTFASFMMICFGGMAWPGFLNSVLLAVHYGLAAPFITLVVATYAKNKVEGLAFFKGLDLFIIMPILSFFFPGAWKYALSFIPMFWTYELYDGALRGSNPLPIFAVGMLVYGFVLLILAKEFKRRVFNA